MSTGHGALVSLTAALCALAVPLGTSAQDLGKRAEGAEAACDTIAAIVKAVPGAKVVRKGDTTTSSDGRQIRAGCQVIVTGDRKSTRLNSSHLVISYAVFCLKKKNKKRDVFRT